MLLKPFTATITGTSTANSQAVANITHTIHGLVWKVYQIGFALGQLAPSPQVAAHVNGVPLTAAVAMQPSVFSAITGQAPYAMESFFVGPPYILLSSGDVIACGLIGGQPGDVFTAAAYVDEFDASDPTNLVMGS
jgi:hypothetical protein